MGFFDRNRQQLVERGIDPARLPPGQYWTQRFPVLHEGEVPDYGDLSGWTRVVVPHLYFWKSATWVRGIEITVEDRPGFWEVNGYHNDADPFREQRYS